MLDGLKKSSSTETDVVTTGAAGVDGVWGVCGVVGVVGLLVPLSPPPPHAAANVTAVNASAATTREGNRMNRAPDWDKVPTPRILSPKHGFPALPGMLNFLAAAFLPAFAARRRAPTLRELLDVLAIVGNHVADVPRVQARVRAGIGNRAAEAHIVANELGSGGILEQVVDVGLAHAEASVDI